MPVLFICKLKKIWIKIAEETWWKYRFQMLKGSSLRSHNIIQLYFRCSRAANSVAKIKFIQTFMGVLVTCKNEEDPFKNEGARVVTTDLPL